MSRRWLAAVPLIALASCGGSREFPCDMDEQCRLGGATGTCTAGWCAFPDPSCTVSQMRYDDSAGDGLGGTCVGENIDAALPPDAMPCAPATTVTTDMTVTVPGSCSSVTIKVWGGGGGTGDSSGDGGGGGAGYAASTMSTSGGMMFDVVIGHGGGGGNCSGMLGGTAGAGTYAGGAGGDGGAPPMQGSMGQGAGSGGNGANGGGAGGARGGDAGYSGGGGGGGANGGGGGGGGATVVSQSSTPIVIAGGGGGGPGSGSIGGGDPGEGGEGCGRDGNGPESGTATAGGGGGGGDCLGPTTMNGFHSTAGNSAEASGHGDGARGGSSCSAKTGDDGLVIFDWGAP